MGLDGPRQRRFRASNGWMDLFFKRYGFVNRRQTNNAQKDPDDLGRKVVNHIAHVAHLRSIYQINDADIILMDETGVWFNTLSSTTIETVGERTVAVRSTGNEKDRATVCLAAKANGAKLKPFILFKGAVRQVEGMARTFARDAVLKSGNSGWMNTELTRLWINTVLGSFPFGTRLLLWDKFRACTEIYSTPFPSSSL